MSTQHHEHELPMLAGIAACLAWLESLAVIVSGPLLTVGLGIALVDLLTDGALLSSTPVLLYVWAVSQAIGVDAQLVGAAFRVRQAARAGQPWAAVGYAVLVLALGYVGILAAQIFATSTADGISTADALRRLGMDSTTWIWQRAVLSVLLVVLSGFLRYVAPAKQRVAAADELATLEHELELEPLRQKLRAQRTVGVAALARQALAAATGHETPHAPHDRPPTGPGSPTSAPAQPDVRTPTRARPAPALHLVAADPPRRRRAATSSGVRTPARENAAAERAARSVWQPGMSVTDLQTAAGISRNAASRWRAVLLAEQGEQREEVAQ